MVTPAAPPENMSAHPASGPARVRRLRSRPPLSVRGSSAQLPHGSELSSGSANSNFIREDQDAFQTLQSSSTKESGPYSRSPELRASHKLAERKRREEMKELIDKLRIQLPADSGTTTWRWAIVSKAIDFIVHLKRNSEQMEAEIARLRHEVATLRQAQVAPPHQPGGPALLPRVPYTHTPPVERPDFPGPLLLAERGVTAQQPQPRHLQPMSRPGSLQTPSVAPLPPPNDKVGNATAPRTGMLYGT